MKEGDEGVGLADAGCACVVLYGAVFESEWGLRRDGGSVKLASRLGGHWMGRMIARDA